MVSETLYRFAACIDMGDFKGLRLTLDDDLTAEYSNSEGSVVIRGGDAFVDYVRDRTRQFDMQHHQLTVYSVVVAGDEAHSLTYYTSYQSEPGTPRRLVTAAARYQDTFRRRGSLWRLAVRQQRTVWRETRLVDEW
jgi:hypothetical protein